MIECKNLSCGYENAVVKNINLTMKDGRFISVLGANGSGKSTFLKTVGGLLPPVDGSVLLDGNDIAHMTYKERAKLLAMLSQTPLIPQMSVYELIMQGRFCKRKFLIPPSENDRQEVKRAAQKIGIDDFLERDAAHLSGGERQKAYLAMIVAQDSHTVLLDEPTTFLDISAQYECLNIVKNMAREGKCVVAVLHDIAQALRMSDEILLVSGGKLISCGNPKEAFESKILDKTFSVTVKYHNGDYYI